jgi:pyrroline-5-carboxylate reductase
MGGGCVGMPILSTLSRVPDTMACLSYWEPTMPTIGFIGAGNMAEAIARGLLRTAVYQPSDIRATDPNPERQRVFSDDLGIECADNCQKAAGGADIVILAVKPFIMAEALQQLAPSLKQGALVISIAAGISSRFIEDTLSAANAAVRVVRVMPNTPMLVGKGMSALARGRLATEHDLIAAERIFSAGGATVRVTEDLLDAVTAVSGSGPAYIFFLTEALAQAGVAAGLTDQQAAQLSRQTVIGAAELLAQSKDSPQELRRKVTTPKGTTQAAIETLEAGGFAGLMTKAIAAAAARSKELGK